MSGAAFLQPDPRAGKGKPRLVRIRLTVAIANKTARTAWAMLVRQEDYRASAMA
jgi:hypothetical protein